MMGLREQAARFHAATPAQWRRLASYLALDAASAASIATSSAREPPTEAPSWQVGAAAARSFAWDDPSSDLPPEAWSARMQITVVAALLDATEVAPQVCVRAAVRGPTETTAATAPSGVSEGAADAS